MTPATSAPDSTPDDNDSPRIALGSVYHPPDEPYPRLLIMRRWPRGIAKGAVADGPVLFEANMSYQIDNMEGLDVWTRSDGAQMVSLISDDNHSILQRNLYLEFVLHDEAEPLPAKAP